MKNNILVSELVGDLSNIKLPEPTLLDYYKRLKDREIFWNMDIDEGIVDFSHQIISWNKEDKDIPIQERTPIKIYINSNGGCLNSIMNFINIIKLSKTPVYTIGMGKCYSAGFLLLISGHRRYCFEYSEGLLHSGSFGIMNSTEKVMDYIDHTRKIEKKLRKYIIDNTSITGEDYDKNYRNEWYMTSEEMVKHGIVNELILDLDILL